MGDDAPVRDLLVSSLTAIVQKFESVVQETREDLRKTEDIVEFLKWTTDYNHGIMKLCGLVPAYVEAMSNLRVQSRAELKKLWTKHCGDARVKQAVDELLEAESNYEKFLAEIDQQQLNPLEDKLTTKSGAQVGQSISMDLKIAKIPSGQQVSLEECLKGDKYTLFVLLRILL